MDYPVAPEAAFEAALAVAQDMGWDVVAADQAAGRIEASDRTFWFGFVDDVVIRVRPTDAGSRVDVRSVSRVGVGDVGKTRRASAPIAPSSTIASAAADQSVACAVLRVGALAAACRRRPEVQLILR